MVRMECALTRPIAVYIFLGMITCGENWWRWVVGIGYTALEFIPSIEPPANMRDADPSWGTEQI